MDVKITNLSPLKLVCYRQIGDYGTLPTTWHKLFDVLTRRGAPMPPRLGMTVYHDNFDEIPVAERRSDAGLVLSGVVEPGEGVFAYEMPGGLYAVMPYFGPSDGSELDGIGPTWVRWRAEWLATSGWKLDKTRPSLEWYQSNQELVPPELQLTLLCDPVCPV